MNNNWLQPNIELTKCDLMTQSKSKGLNAMKNKKIMELDLINDAKLRCKTPKKKKNRMDMKSRINVMKLFIYKCT